MSVRIGGQTTVGQIIIDYRGYEVSVITWQGVPELMIFVPGDPEYLGSFQPRMASMESIIEAKEHIDNMIDTKTKLIWATNHRFARR